jgi:3-hydroxybutyryl-CoA dehydrogenase
MVIITAMKPSFQHTAVVGTGAMGRGIAQIAAQAGSQVLLFDTQPQAAQKAQQAICSQWDKLAEKGRLSAEQVGQYKERLQCADALAALAGCDLVVEAIVENLAVKRELFGQLEGIVAMEAVLASNTS